MFRQLPAHPKFGKHYSNGLIFAPESSYALDSVAFSVAGGAVKGEIAEIDISAYPDTNLSYDNFNNVDFTTASGAITIQTLATVPEPGSPLPLAAAVLFCAWYIRRRRVA